MKTVLDTNNNGFSDFDISNTVRAAKTIMKRFDANGDKKLSAAELAPIKESLRDEDADGKGVTRKEVMNWLVNWHKQLIEMPVESPVTAQQIPDSKSEIKTISLAALLSRKGKELTAYDLSSIPYVMTRVMKKLDKDKDSNLSSAETKLVIEPIDEADLNDDGVSRRELFHWLIAWHNRLK